MNTRHSRPGPARQSLRYWRRGPVFLAAGLVTALLIAGCDTGQQVPWASYSSQLQPRIDAARATGNCAVLQLLLTGAKATSGAHEKATGFPNDALVSYIQAAQHEAGCAAKTG